MYQVIVDYRGAPTWRAPVEDGDAARARYARECARIAKGGIRQVVLLKDGVIVAREAAR